MKLAVFRLAKITVVDFALYAVLTVLACKSHKSQAAPDKVSAMMTTFFTISRQEPGSMEGLWVAERESVSKLIEKKYLSNYVAKPDEMEANEIRARLKSLSIFFRIDRNNLTMLSIVSDSFGFSPGRLKKRAAAGAITETYDALMRGKQGSTTNAVLRLRKMNGIEKLEYEENGLVMTAVREMRPAADLVAHYSQQVKAGTGLAQY